eukprot:sb/3475440/
MFGDVIIGFPQLWSPAWVAPFGFGTRALEFLPSFLRFLQLFPVFLSRQKVFDQGHGNFISPSLLEKTLKSGCLSLLTIRSFGAHDGLGLSVRVWLGFGLGVRLGLSILRCRLVYSNWPCGCVAIAV